MQPRTLDAILAELAPVYDPQVANYRTRQNEIPNQIKAEEEGLAAKQTNAFSEIVNGARRRGLGFSGIPVGEQARYNAQEYMPALARLRQSGREQALSLEDAILGINERRQNQALGIRQYEQSRYDAFQEAERARRAAAAQQASMAGLFGGGRGGMQGVQAPGTGIKYSPLEQNAIKDVQDRFNNPQMQPEDILSDYIMTYKNAQKGNARDRIKLQIYASNLGQVMPMWQGNADIGKRIMDKFKRWDVDSIRILNGVYRQPSAVPASSVVSNRLSF